MMICHAGLDGSGKTYAMAEHALKMIANGKDCFGTFSVRGMRPLEGARQLIKIENAHIYFDEWHQDLDAKQWFNLDPVIRHMVSQHRHYRLVVHYTTQDFFYMDPFIRRETTFVWEHEALFRNPDTGDSRFRLHRARRYMAKEIELKRRHPKILESKTFFLDKKILCQYDSFKKVILTSKHVSDAELEAIADPYAIAPIEDPKDGPVKVIVRNVSSLKNQLVEEHQEAEEQPRGFQNEEDQNNLAGSIEGEDPAKERDAVMDVREPREGIITQLVRGWQKSPNEVDN